MHLEKLDHLVCLARQGSQAILVKSASRDLPDMRANLAMMAKMVPTASQAGQARSAQLAPMESLVTKASRDCQASMALWGL